MPHIPLPDELPGIAGLLAYKPTTGSRLGEFIHELLRGPSPLTAAEREVIAAYVSQLNECQFCARSHGAAAHHLDDAPELRDATLAGPNAADLDPKLRALLRLAGAAVHGGQHVTAADVATAREAGATDDDIHDTILIAAAFCMLNRYVDGLATATPTDQSLYDQMGARLAHDGYRRPTRQLS